MLYLSKVNIKFIIEVKLPTNYIDYLKRVFDQNVGEIKVTFVNLEVI